MGQVTRQGTLVCFAAEEMAGNEGSSVTVTDSARVACSGPRGGVMTEGPERTAADVLTVVGAVVVAVVLVVVVAVFIFGMFFAQ